MEAHRAFIDRWFYPCSVEMHASLASLYENDPRFSAQMDAAAPGATAVLIAGARAAEARAG